MFAYAYHEDLYVRITTLRYVRMKKWLDQRRGSEISEVAWEIDEIEMPLEAPLKLDEFGTSELNATILTASQRCLKQHDFAFI